MAHAITGHTYTSKSMDYCPNCTRKCVINYANHVCCIDLSSCNANPLLAVLSIDSCEYHSPNDLLLSMAIIRKQLSNF